jgi:hypothetical protein
MPACTHRRGGQGPDAPCSYNAGGGTERAIEPREQLGIADFARAYRDCCEAQREAMTEVRLAATELAQNAADLAARAGELRLERQRERARLTGVAMSVPAWLTHSDSAEDTPPAPRTRRRTSTSRRRPRARRSPRQATHR